MKITYEFTNENVVIDVPDEWGEVVLELDRQEYNNNHRETRRHCSLDAYDADHNLVASGDDIEQEFVQKEDNEKLYRALDELELRQRELITRIIINNETIKSIALENNVTEGAIRHRLTKALNRLKKFLK